MQNERDYIVLCRSLVEKKLMLGNGTGRLRQRDFEYVAEVIEQKSRIKLSLSTLKRLWKTDIQQVPHPSTLDAIVSVLDISDWQAFKQANFEHVKSQANEPKQERQGAMIKRIAAVLTILSLAIFIGLQGFGRRSGVVISGEVKFAADKMISAGVPNTVGFSYDVSAVRADSFFIQQSWNPRDKMPIDPKKNFLSTIYYTPGFHFARIMAHDSILMYRKVHIQTDGWLPLVKYNLQDKYPVYLDGERIISNGVMRATDHLLHRANVRMDQEFSVRYYNIRDFDHVNSSNFDLETRIKCDSLVFEGRLNTVPCPTAEVMLVTEEGVFFVPLTTRGCVSELSLLVGDEYRSGKDSDLSALGVSPFQWQTLRIKNENKEATIYLNGEAAMQLKYSKEFGEIKGIIFTFSGPGSVDYVRMKSPKGATSYQEEF